MEIPTQNRAPRIENITQVMSDIMDLVPEEIRARVENTIASTSTVYGDEKRIRLIIFSLLTACAQYVKKENRILLSCRDRVLTVDLMISVTPDPHFILLAKRLLEQTEDQVSLQSLASFPDSYILLLAAKRIANEQNVKIRIDSDGASDCTLTCQFLVPRKPSTPQRDKPLILIIEDNRDIRRLIELYLSQAGYDTLCAEGGETGLQMAFDHLPDLITLDVWMPSKDGWQVLKALKENTATSAIPVVVVSIMRDMQIGFELGASDYVVKPIQHPLLLRSVGRLLFPNAGTTRPAKILKKIGLIDRDLQGVDMLMEFHPSIDWVILESESPELYNSIDAAGIDALLFVLWERTDTLLPLITRMRLIDTWADIPMYGLNLGETDTSAIIADGILDRIFSREEISAGALTAPPAP